MKGLKIHIIIAVCIVTLGIALLGQRFLYQQRVADPLLARIQQITGVANASFATIGDKRFIVITPAAGSDLRQTYNAAYDLGKQSLGAAFGGITLRDNRDPALTDTFYQMHFYVQQGIATGMFTDMSAGIDQIAKQNGLSAHKVFVDRDNVYVQLERGGHQLFEVVPRPQVQMVAQVQSEGRGAAW